jgi:hypothetical protein
MKRNDNMVRILGSTAHCNEERESLDFYATDPKSLQMFLSRIKEDDIQLHQNIWEIACGDGAISNHLKDLGHTVWCTDIVNRKNTCDATIDITKNLEGLIFCGDILTNPPYKHARCFIEKSMDMVRTGSKVIMYLRLQFLEGKKRKKLFDKYPPKYVYVHTTRQMTYKNNEPSERKKGSAVCFAWFIWEKGYFGDPRLRWI